MLTWLQFFSRVSNTHTRWAVPYFCTEMENKLVLTQHWDFNKRFRSFDPSSNSLIELFGALSTKIWSLRISFDENAGRCDEMTSQATVQIEKAESFSQPQSKVGLYFASVPVVDNSQKSGHFLNIFKRSTSGFLFSVLNVVVILFVINRLSRC